MTGVVRFVPKPRPDREREGVIAAKYAPGGPLDAVGQVAGLAYLGEVAECTLPSGETVLVARWRAVPDGHAPHWDYAVVHDGHWLYFSVGYEHLGEDTDAGLASWYVPEGVTGQQVGNGRRVMSDRTYTHPDVFTVGVEQGWAEAETDPTRIDWPARQAAAAIPFEVLGGRPVNPCAATGIRYGRNELGLWGENLMADALVTVTLPPFGARYLLMVERGDGYGWAVPGGAAEPGESAGQAAARELEEETGLTVSPGLRRAGEPVYVPDPRASDEAWAVTVPVVIDLGCQDTLPELEAADDARRAEWIPADTYAHLVDALARDYGGQVFAAHVDMLRQFLGGAS